MLVVLEYEPPSAVGLWLERLGLAFMLPPVLTTLFPLLLLLLLSIPLLPLALLLLELGAKGAVFLDVAGTFAVVADDVAAVALHRRHGSPASCDLF